jgi:archaellum component FlaC
MKLTKGKIRKLYNKKNQTLKKYKNKKASYERKSFRNKKQVNLARKTLKEFAYNKPRGGGGNEETPKDKSKSKGFFSFLPKTSRKPKQTEQSDAKTSSTLENIKQVDIESTENTPIQVAEDINKSSADIVSSEPPATTVNETVEPVTTTTTETVNETVEPVTTTTETVNETVEPVTTTTDTVNETVEPVTTTTTDTTVNETVEPVTTTTDTVNETVEPVTTTDTTVNETVEPVTTTADTTVTETVEPVTTTTDTVNETVEPAKEDTAQPIKSSSTETTKNIPSSEIVNSLSTVTNYFADVIADKVTQNISAISNQDKPQDGFISVNKAAETMAASGGKKYKKTKRFRLTNNKTKKLQ